MQVLDQALRFAERGLRVIPIPEGSKGPKLARWQQRASTDPEQLQRWFARPHNLGVVPAGSQYAIVDLDVKRVDGVANWRSLLRERGGDESEVVVETPSGGQHWYYRIEQETRSLKRHDLGIELCASTGQCVAPPSVVGSGTYRWQFVDDVSAAPPLPGWVLELQPEAHVPTAELVRDYGVGSRNTSLLIMAKRLAYAGMTLEQVYDCCLWLDSRADTPLAAESQAEFDAVVRRGVGYGGKGRRK